MISYEIDPTLHPAEPAPQQLDDGFSPPMHGESQPPEPMPVPAPVLSEKSPF